MAKQTLAEKLNDLKIEFGVTKGVIDLLPQEVDLDVEGLLLPHCRWIEDCVTYFDRPDNGFTYQPYVEYGDEIARWSNTEKEWVRER